MKGPQSCLTLEDITLKFGRTAALQDLTLEVRHGEILALIGPNGSGKTSLINCISGFYRPERGRISLYGRDITHLPPHQTVRAGIGRTFQGLELFDGLTVLDNLLTARHFRMRGFLFSLFAGGLNSRRGNQEEARHREAAEKIIHFLEMESWRNKSVSECSFGMQKRIALGRALCLEPKVLLLDEPTAGLASESREELMRFLIDIHAEMIPTLMIVEHNLDVVMEIADRVVVMESGRVALDGAPRDMMNHPELAAVYLGRPHDSI